MAQQKVQSIDPAQSRFGFEIKTRFGTKIEGFFPRFRGDVVTLADGRQQVRFRLDATQVEIPARTGTPAGCAAKIFRRCAVPGRRIRVAAVCRRSGEAGGDIVGNLTIRGITHLETLHVVPAECTRPGYDCDVISRGTVLRGRYGMNAWQMALGDRVTFILRGRLQEARRP